MQVEKLPREPGVYLFKGRDGEILYIGKAKSLRSRVRSYFRGVQPPKTQALVKKIKEIDYVVVNNEVEALLLENRLIKQHAPRYNINLKDAKTYAYLKITNEKFPRVISTRRITKDGEYFGPYTDGRARAELHRLITRIFKLRTCKRLPKRECLNYHIGLCTAPCIANVSEEEYAGQVERARSFLKGDVEGTMRRLRKEMEEASAQTRYEEALERKRQIEAIEHHMKRQAVDRIRKDDQDAIALSRSSSHAFFTVLSVRRGVIRGKEEFRVDIQDEVFEGFLKAYYDARPLPNEVIVSEAFWEEGKERSVLEEYLSSIKGARVRLTCPQRGEKRRLAQIAQKNLKSEDVLTMLKDELNLPAPARIIECFDVSNLGHEHIVAGMVRFANGVAEKSGYRRFLIRSISQADDYSAMKEAVVRRYSRVLKEEQELPDLVLIDGGPGQLRFAQRALREAGVALPIVALAKQHEELYLPEEDSPRKYPANSPMLLLLRRIRDETHRYSVTYNRKRREMGMRPENP